MDVPREVSFTRRRPIGSPLIVAGSSMVADHLFAVADRMKVEVDYLRIDDSGRPSDLSKAREVELLWCHGRFAGSWVMSAVISLPGLDWVHSDFVGVDALDLEVFESRGIAITNGGNNFARPMAEYITLGILASAKQFPFFVRKSDAAMWDTSLELRELEGAKVLLLGLGAVNSLVAQMCMGFDLDVVAWTRTKHATIPDGVSRNITGDRWLDELADADYVVVSLPLTPETEGLIDSKVLRIAKPDVTIINLARGGLIDEDALVRALDSGRLRYVLLDAYTKEPLPSESPLWKRSNVTVLPHHSWSSHQVLGRTIELFASQLHRWANGVPLFDPVDFRAGY